MPRCNRRSPCRADCGVGSPVRGCRVAAPREGSGRTQSWAARPRCTRVDDRRHLERGSHWLMPQVEAVACPGFHRSLDRPPEVHTRVRSRVGRFGQRSSTSSPGSTTPAAVLEVKAQRCSRRRVAGHTGSVKSRNRFRTTTARRPVDTAVEGHHDPSAGSTRPVLGIRRHGNSEEISTRA